MKINLHGKGFDFILENYHSGVTTFPPRKNEGRYQVKRINSVNIFCDVLIVYCELLDTDLHHPNNKVERR